MQWAEFKAACPEIAALAEGRFARDDLVLLGTLRRDGRPRISPVEPDTAAGHLFLGMMPRSAKALDLFLDPRCVVHSVPSDRLNPAGDIKLYGTATDVQDPELRARYREAIKARIDWAPAEPDYHLFAIDIAEAAYVRFDEDAIERWHWTPDRGLRKSVQPND